MKRRKKGKIGRGGEGTFERKREWGQLKEELQPFSLQSPRVEIPN